MDRWNTTISYDEGVKREAYRESGTTCSKDQDDIAGHSKVPRQNQSSHQALPFSAFADQSLSGCTQISVKTHTFDCRRDDDGGGIELQKET